MQKVKVIAYASKESKFHEKKYPTHDIESVVVVFAVKICHYYLYDIHVYIFTDHKILKYAFT